MGQNRATERISFDEALVEMPRTEAHVKTVLARLRQLCSFASNATVLDVGAGQGLALIACAREGLKAIGVEPWEQARQTGLRLAEHEGVEIKLLAGKAESIPLPSSVCDVVLANTVIEHVIDAAAAFAEVYRILKPGGVFWFSTVSSLCPHQSEISGFPFFGWYPNWLKVRIMIWAKTNKPSLIGYTETPALNWFTPWKARQMLNCAGFKRIYDRWEIRLPSEGDAVCRAITRIIRAYALAKLCADILIPGCAYAAVK